MSIYDQYGVPTIINACGTVTRLGGATMPPAVLDAFRDAATDAVSLEQLQAAASRIISRHTATEAAIVTAGAAASMTLGTAAILTGFDLSRMERLPHCDFPHEFLIAREQRSGYDHAVRAAGAKLVEVGFNEIVSGAGVRRTEAWEYEAAINSQTVGVIYAFTASSAPRLDEVVAVAHRHNLPVLVDAAGELPPRNQLRSIAASGADLVAFSGGKAIRGPQSTGILCGRRDLISAAVIQMLDMDDHFELWEPPQELIDKRRFPGLPRHGIGRALKVSKEEIIALLTALELFTSGAYDKQAALYRGWLEKLVSGLKGLAVAATISDPGDGESPPRLEIQIIGGQAERKAFEIARALRAGKPPIYVGHVGLSAGKLIVNPVCLRDDQIAALAKRLVEEIAKTTKK